MNKKMFYRIIPSVFILFMMFVDVYGYSYGGLGSGLDVNDWGSGFDPSLIPSGNEVQEIKAPIERIWNTISLILQVCAVGGIVFTGVRYMFASADIKSDMKQSMPYLIIGMIIVFAAPAIINFIVDVVKDITK